MASTTAGMESPKLRKPDLPFDKAAPAVVVVVVSASANKAAQALDGVGPCTGGFPRPGVTLHRHIDGHIDALDGSPS